MAATEKSREEFVDRVERFLVHYDFDGLDVDWEYPAQRGGLPEDRENFAELVKLLGERLNHRNRLLTIAVGVARYLLDTSYDIPRICEYSNLVFLMGYDLQYPDLTSVHAPLRRETSEPETREYIAYVVDHFISHGCPAEKIIFGIPAYGRTYTLNDTAQFGLGAPVDGPGNKGPFTEEAGFLGYNEICDLMDVGQWNTFYLEENAALVAVQGNQWIGFDDTHTVKQKTEFAVEKKLGGVMFWSIDTDDFHGFCRNGSYPLLRTANEVYGNDMNFEV